MNGPVLEGVRGVLFDLDGTLLDTLQDLADTVNAVLRAAGHPPHPLEAYRHFVGDGVRVLMARALPSAAGTEEGVRAAVAAFRREYAVRWAARTRRYPGVDTMLEGLFARGLRVGILSNKPDDFTKKTVHALLDRWHFDLVWGEGPQVPHKPDPTGARRAAAAWGLEPARIVFCGDTAVDMETAVAAGMIPVGALWGFRDEAELRGSGARFVIERPPDLLGLV